jgi:hypothetical protein
MTSEESSYNISNTIVQRGIYYMQFLLYAISFICNFFYMQFLLYAISFIRLEIGQYLQSFAIVTN